VQQEPEQKVQQALRPSAPLGQLGLAQQELQALGLPELPLAQPLLAWRLGMPREAS
jgi:hypothetical protein